MAVDEHVNARDLVEQVDGADTGAGALLINAQMAQADDVVALGLGQFVHLSLGSGIQVLAGSKGNALDLGGVRLGGSLGGIQTEDADLSAALGGEDGIGIKSHRILIGDVGRQDGELSSRGQGLQVLITVVELVVAGGGSIIARHIHQLDSGSALGDADIGRALDKIAGIQQVHGSAGLLVHGLQRGDLGVVLNRAVDVVGVENDNRILSILGDLIRGNRLCGRFALFPVCQASRGQTKGHDHRQQEGEQLVPLSHGWGSS